MLINYGRYIHHCDSLKSFLLELSDFLLFLEFGNLFALESILNLLSKTLDASTEQVNILVSFFDVVIHILDPFFLIEMV